MCCGGKHAETCEAISSRRNRDVRDDPSRIVVSDCLSERFRAHGTDFRGERRYGAVVYVPAALVACESSGCR